MGVTRAGRWFHTIVVMGTSLTACGGRATDETAGPDAASGPGDARGEGAATAKGDGGAADASPPVSTPDAAFRRDAASAPDSGETTAFCCSGYCTFQCRRNDAGAPVCSPNFCGQYCGCIQ